MTPKDLGGSSQRCQKTPRQKLRQKPSPASSSCPWRQISHAGGELYEIGEKGRKAPQGPRGPRSRISPAEETEINKQVSKILIRKNQAEVLLKLLPGLLLFLDNFILLYPLSISVSLCGFIGSFLKPGVKSHFVFSLFWLAWSILGSSCRRGSILGSRDHVFL